MSLGTVCHSQLHFGMFFSKEIMADFSGGRITSGQPIPKITCLFGPGGPSPGRSAPSRSQVSEQYARFRLLILDDWDLPFTKKPVLSTGLAGRNQLRGCPDCLVGGTGFPNLCALPAGGRCHLGLNGVKLIFYSQRPDSIELSG